MIKKYSIRVNGSTYDVEVEELGTEGVASPRTQAPRSVASKAVVAKTKVPSVVSGGSGSINAPMPGTINDVRVKVGDSVKKGQVLLILEAMKMENEIMASCDGAISGVSVSKGASVSVGDTLITIG